MDLTIFLLLVAISLIKFGQGIDIDIKSIYFRDHNYWLIFRSVITVVFLVPILFFFLILILRPGLNIIAAIMILAVSPGAHTSIERVKKLGGNVSLAAQVQILSASITIVTAPLLLQTYEFLLGLHLDISFTHLIRNFAEAQFIPIVVGIILRQLIPNIGKLTKYSMPIAKILLLGCFVILIYRNYEFITSLKLNAYFMIILVTASAFLLGVIMAGRNAKNQISLAIESGMRNLGLAYVIASNNFIQERVNAAMLPFVILSVATIFLSTFLLKIVQKKWRSNA